MMSPETRKLLRQYTSAVRAVERPQDHPKLTHSDLLKNVKKTYSALSKQITYLEERDSELSWIQYPDRMGQ